MPKKHRKMMAALAQQQADLWIKEEQALPPPPAVLPNVGAGDYRASSSVTIPEVEQQFRDREEQAQAAYARLEEAQRALDEREASWAEQEAERSRAAAAGDNELARQLRELESGGAGTRARKGARRFVQGEGDPELEGPPAEGLLPEGGSGKWLLAAAAAAVAFFLWGS